MPQFPTTTVVTPCESFGHIAGVRTTLVSPGAVDTALWDAIDPDNRPGFTPRAAMLRPEDVAAAVLYAVTQPATVNVDELRLGPA